MSQAAVGIFDETPAERQAAPVDVEEQCRQGLRLLRRRSLVNTIRTKIGSSRLRFFVAVGCSILFWWALFVVFLRGFQFLETHRLVTGPLIELLFGLFFASLLVMLVFSTSIILFGGLFKSMEAEFLLIRPIPPDRIFAFKFQEALAFSSWGFLLLGSPMMVAYGLSTGAPWWFYVLGLPYFLSFALLPGAFGALATLLVTAYAPRNRRRIVIAAASLLVAGLLYFMARTLWVSREAPSPERWVASVFQQLRISNLPFLPSQWISRGLLAASYREGLSDACFYLMILVSQALAAYLLTAWAYRRLYRGAFDRVRSTGGGRRKLSTTWLPWIVDRLFASFSSPVRVLLTKDVRVFSRDPLQWLQVVIFTGLLAIYFSNLHRVTLFSTSPYWRNLLGFFNVAVTGLLLSAYTSRFIFPLMSLEGQKFWILGLAPISRSAILWGKFAFSVGGSLLVTAVLTLVSAFMLKLDPFLVVLQLVGMVIICFGVSGIAVGFGAKFPEINETDPSRIASGFGGTLNLITSLIFIVFVIATLALPCHLYSLTLELEQGLATARDLRIKESSGITFEQFRLGLVISMTISVTAGVIATWAPMRMGIRAFESREF